MKTGDTAIVFFNPDDPWIGKIEKEEDIYFLVSDKEKQLWIPKKFVVSLVEGRERLFKTIDNFNYVLAKMRDYES